MTVAAPVRKLGPRLASLAREWGPVLFLSLIPAMPLLLGSGIVNTRAGGDSPFLLVRLQQLVVSLRDGVFPVRWMPQAAYGLGYPFFNFYASLPYHIAALFKLAGLGYLASIKLTQTLGFVLAGVAMYGLLKQLGRSRLASLIGALVYGCVPFHLVNVYVRGDSLSEFYAFVFYPLILDSFLQLARLRSLRPLNQTISALAVAALAYAGLMLTHNLSAFIFTPFLLLYILLLVRNGDAGSRVRTLFSAAVALAGGLLLSAWFWAPALLERYSVSLEDMTTGYFNYAQHFRSSDLVQLRFAFDYAITADTNPFRMGLIQALLLLAGVVCAVVRWLRARHFDAGDAFALLTLVFSTWMITPWSSRLWEKLPLLPMVQFPWRFLSIQAVASGMLAAGLVPRRRPIRWTLALMIGMATLASTLASLHPEPLLIREQEVTSERLAQYEYFTANIGTTIRADWLPRSVDPRPFTSEAIVSSSGKPLPLVLRGQVSSVSLSNSTATSETWQIQVTTADAVLGFQTYYFPGWRARIDGRDIALEQLPGLGYIGLSVPQGTHQVHLWLGRTRTRLAAELASTMTVAVLLAYWIWEAKHNSAALRLLLIVGLASALWLGLVFFSDSVLPSSPSSQITTQSAALDLTMDFDRVPFLHHNPDGVVYPAAGRFIGYTVSSTDIRAGEVLTVTSRWSETTDKAVVARVSLATPAWHLFGVPIRIAESLVPLTSGTLQHTLPIPSTTTRGLYLLRLDVLSEETEVRAVNSRGETLGTTYLVPVRVDSPDTGPANEPPIAPFGTDIHLVDLETNQRQPGQLEVTPVWSAQTRIAANYKVALRLRDSTSWEVARLDVQPGYGFYPTSMWRPAELVWDRYLLTLDEGTPPGTNYALDVTLYESASLRQIGTASFPNITLTMPTIRNNLPVAPLLAPGLALLDSRIQPVELRSGEKLSAVLKWGSLTALSANLRARLSLLNDTGAVVATCLAPLVEGYLSSQWPTGSVVQQHYEMAIDRDLPSGVYSLRIEVIDEADGVLGASMLSPTVQVTRPERTFVLPPIQHPLGVDYGGRLYLAGYDLSRSESEVVLTLYWRGASTMDIDYKVFVHLFDPTTERIATQQDTLVGGVDHPTSQWVPDEVVAQTVSMPLQGVPAGSYRLAVGTYDPQGRLPISAPESLLVSADRLLLPQEINQP